MDKISRKELRFSGPIDLLGIEELRTEVQVNSHGTLFLRGTLSSKNYEDIRKKQLFWEKFRLFYEDNGKERTLFAGFVNGVEILQIGGVYRISLTGVSGSILFDRKKKIEFYQNSRLTYGKLLSQIAGDDRVILPMKKKDERLQHPLFQYKETDWKFILRLAGQYHTVVVPEVVSGYPQISFGLPRGTTAFFDFVERYTVKRSFVRDRKTDGGGNKVGAEAKLREMITCTVFSSENIEVGSPVHFRDSNWYVMKKRMLLWDGLLEMEYELGNEETHSMPYIGHPGIQGLDLKGTVLWTGGEQIKIKMSTEKRQNINELFAYPYFPVTGNLLYSMPEKGETVLLHFPQAEEQGCFIVNCEGAQKKGGLNPKIKIFQTKDKKQVVLSPQIVAFQTVRRNRRTSVSLKDGWGTEFSTVGAVHISGKKNVRIKAGGSCVISSDALLTAVQRGSGNRIELSGNSIRMNAERYLFSTPLRKSLRTGPPRMIDLSAGDALYTFALGAIPSGAVDERTAGAAAAIPAVCAAVGPAAIAESIGWGRTKKE